MAVVSNVNRKATAKALLHDLDGFLKLAGVAIQTHRAYESASRGSAGLTQGAVAAAAGHGVNQPMVSDLENGKTIPPDPQLGYILGAAGFDMQPGHGGHALQQILRSIRDHRDAFQLIRTEKPA